MYKVAFFLVAFIAIGTGLLVGTFNSAPVTLDLLWVQITWPLGLLVLLALSIGILAGMGGTWLFKVLPLKVRMRSLSANKSDQTSSPGLAPDD